MDKDCSPFPHPASLRSATFPRGGKAFSCGGSGFEFHRGGRWGTAGDAAAALASPSGGLVDCRRQWRMQAGREQRSGQNLQANERAQQILGTASRALSAKLTEEGRDAEPKIKAAVPSLIRPRCARPPSPGGGRLCRRVLPAKKAPPRRGRRSSAYAVFRALLRCAFCSRPGRRRGRRPAAARTGRWAQRRR